MGELKTVYMGQASLRFVTPENKVIYVDPYCGNNYDLAADLILITHGHFDHCNLDKIEKRNNGCVIITHKEALVNGEHKTFEFDFVKVEAVEAGNNRNHSVKECVGYLLTFSNGITVYVSGDTSRTNQMQELSGRDIDYAFYCTDGIYNMGLKEAAECAALVGAKHNIPYHNSPGPSRNHFSLKAAQKFKAPNLMIVEPGIEVEFK